MKLPLHYVVNETMRPLAEKYFLPSIPSGFQAVEHKVEIHTSGNFLEDNYRRVLEERTRLIIEEINCQPDNGIMLWSDVDVVFFADFVKEVTHLAEGNDILLQREGNWSDEANWGLKIIRRNAKTLAFYTQLLQMQQASDDGNDQPIGNRLLRTTDGLIWKNLPFHYSSESNGGCKTDSVLYHANCTGGNSLKKKFGQLKAASVIKRFDTLGKQLKSGSDENAAPVSNHPIYAYSAYGLTNRLLCLTHTMELCHILQRPMVLIWENNFHVGHTHFHDLFENDIAIISRKPSDVPDVWGGYPQILFASSLPNDRATVIVCNDIITFPGVGESTVRPRLQQLRLVSTLQDKIDEYTRNHDLSNAFGIHMRRGDKLKETQSGETLRRVEIQYDMLINNILGGSNASIYLSCDELAVVDKYKDIYGNRVLSLNKKENPLNRTGKSISEAVLDLYLLSKTRFVFYGVGTFGYTASFINGNQGRNILNQDNKLLICFKEIEDKRLPDPIEIVSSVMALPQFGGLL